MSNISEISKKECVGCRACEKSCPKKAIVMKEDKEGFIYPSIDCDKCINCSICVKSCPTKFNVKEDTVKKIYAATSKNHERIKKSASGGVSDVIAKYIIENNGVVFGSAYDSNYNVHHVKIDNIGDLDRIKSSKYVFSDTKNTYIEAKEALLKGKKVLYTGTSCQIDGLIHFLKGVNCDNLYTVNIICHGVPSNKLFKLYISWLEKKEKSKVVNYNFRSKEKYGWGTNLKIEFLNGKKVYKDLFNDPYGIDFLKGKNYRESCYNCKYANLDRIGDFTLGDFWGINESNPEFYNEEGVSVVLINSEKGIELFEKIKEDIKYIECTKEAACVKQTNLIMPTPRHQKRDNYYKKMDLSIFDKNEIYSLKSKIKKIIPIGIKSTIKKIMKKARKS